MIFLATSFDLIIVPGIVFHHVDQDFNPVRNWFVNLMMFIMLLFQWSFLSWSVINVAFNAHN